MLAMPLPGKLDGRAAQRRISPAKDVEGVSPASLGLLTLGDESMAPTTARAAFELARSTGVEIAGAEVVIVGHSEVVGKPLSILFLNAFGTTTVCHVETKDLARHTRCADILCVAVGKPRLITGEMIKPGAVVIDIGISRIEVVGADGGTTSVTVGDVDFESASEAAGWITPVPGGVGPMTVEMLLENVVLSARRQFGMKPDARGRRNGPGR
jgi:methylenetetrahydrofolate dehydrogenase (NADP+)/methenyltetrahydrofolate cyclohydrolase